MGIYNFAVYNAIRYENKRFFQESVLLFNRLHGREAKLRTQTIELVFRQINVMSPEEFEALASFVRDDVIDAIALTPWADGFQKLQEQVKA